MRLQYLFAKKNKQRGVSMTEFVIAFPIVLIMGLLCLQLVLMYRAKLAHNYAVQEAGRIGAMGNGRPIPRFVTEPFVDIFARSAYLGVASLGKAMKSSSGPATNSPVANSSQSNDVARRGAGAAAVAQILPKLDTLLQSNNKLKTILTDIILGLWRNGDSSVLQGYMNGITPFYMPASSTSGNRSDNSVWQIGTAQVDAYVDGLFNTCILYHSPTQAAFLEYASIELQGLDHGILKLPADYMRFRSVMGTRFARDGEEEGGANQRGSLTGMTLQENTILSVEVMWSYPLKVPIAREIILGLTRLENSFLGGDNGMAKKFREVALSRGRYPFTGVANYRAQNALHWHPFYPLGQQVPPITASDGIEVFDIIALIWREIISTAERDFNPAEPQIGFCLGIVPLPSDDDLNPIPGDTDLIPDDTDPVIDETVPDDGDSNGGGQDEEPVRRCRNQNSEGRKCHEGYEWESGRGQFPDRIAAYRPGSFMQL